MRSSVLEGYEIHAGNNDLIVGGALLSDERPTDGQVMRYNAAANAWRPGNVSVGGAALTVADLPNPIDAGEF